MKLQTIKITYWTITGIFVFATAITGIPTEAGKEMMNTLGYPAYLSNILLIAKIFGAIAVVQPKFKTIKEWAYAGFTIDFIGAAVSGVLATGKIQFVIMPIIFLGVMFLSYFLWKKRIQLIKIND